MLHFQDSIKRIKRVCIMRDESEKIIDCKNTFVIMIETVKLQSDIKVLR